jgi:hypothetical protein
MRSTFDLLPLSTAPIRNVTVEHDRSSSYDMIIQLGPALKHIAHPTIEFVSSALGGDIRPWEVWFTLDDRMSSHSSALNLEVDQRIGNHVVSMARVTLWSYNGLLGIQRSRSGS